MQAASENSAWASDEFVAALYAQSNYYCHRHPFLILMNEGHLKPFQVQRWAANCFYYQACLPLKDAALLSQCPELTVRRIWLQRLVAQDGLAEGQGAIEEWLSLAEAVGLSREEVLDERHVLPGVRFATEAYVTFARTRSWTETAATSLSELFASDLLRESLAAFEYYYSWIDPAGLTYFKTRLRQEQAEARQAIDIVVRHCRTREQQERAVAALKYKCDVLWSILDAIAYAVLDTKEDTAPTDEVTMSSQPHLRAQVRLQWDQTRGKPVLLLADSILILNATAATILSLCDGQHSISAIVAELSRRYNRNVEQDVLAFLARLFQKGVIEYTGFAEA
ncbi:pyrroloquinoline quinone biosynthesis protein PqqC [Ktedonosporobacter rubrisoli]|uniref:Pyrroloquinoline-quinone synthase n=1 Tax=Ktedonosporobacter rubrisoli TaxID=2509675 RepID=A0A4P6K3L1_KTERU|nr:pyrroloquinoline-quinone synthase PqqC [Ktedonosporobacter rubrisoli]QBD82552.1 pyrroloquinoline quinone biosynthesis protein PqqC [Ktedonosporobacter rubrisoli]